jgi:N-acetyl-1-D-myo-inositol-2-amino-2-deoxy-alpha-D-glucopyranoside deacetylase
MRTYIKDEVIVLAMAIKLQSFKGMFFGFIYAILAAGLGTLMHQTQVEAVPVGLLFSLSLVLLSAGAIRDKQTGKLPGLAFTVTLAVAIFVIGQNFTTDILIPGNDIGLWWSYGSIGIAALVGLWPKLKKATG